MCDPIALVVAATIVSAGGKIASGMAASQQANYQAKLDEHNARLSAEQANDANVNTKIEAQRRYREGAQLAGRQNAAMAANGVDLGFGSALQTQEDTAMITGEDVGQIYKGGAEKMKGFDINAFNFRADAAAQRAKAKAAKIATIFGVAETALGGASQIQGMKK